MLDRLKRTARRTLHLPATVDLMNQRLQSVEHLLQRQAAGPEPSPELEPAPPSYAPPPYPALAAEHVAGAVVYANRVDALAHAERHGRIAEVGVAAGDFTATMLEVLQPSHFDAIDIFRLHELRVLWGRPTTEWFEGRTHRGYYEHRFAEELAAGVMSVHEGDSSAIIADLPDGVYDMIYIDGDHSYEGVLRDAEASVSKLTPDGLLVFNDYITMDHHSCDPYGVIPVVNEFCVNRGWKVAYFAFNHDMFCDIALRTR